MRCLPDLERTECSEAGYSQGISSFGNPYSVSRLSCPKPATRPTHARDVSEVCEVVRGDRRIRTFLMVFIIRNTQSRDAKAIQLKLDELIRAVHGARTGLVRLEELSEEDLAAPTCDFDPTPPARRRRTAGARACYCGGALLAGGKTPIRL